MSDAQSYRIPSPHYRDGTLHPEGTIITIPADERPGRGWELVSEALPDKAPAAKKTDRAPVRASDASPI